MPAKTGTRKTLESMQRKIWTPVTTAVSKVSPCGKAAYDASCEKGYKQRHASEQQSDLYTV